MKKMSQFIVLGLLLGLPQIVRSVTFTVTSTNDSSASGTLRWAIQSANTNADFDHIEFNISGTAPFTIFPTGALPSIVFSASIVATNITGYTNTPLIILDGQLLTNNESGLTLETTSCTVRALGMYRFPEYGLHALSGGYHTIRGCHIFHNYGGMRIDDSAYNLIGGTLATERNVISSNSILGIILIETGALQNVIYGNYIGVDASGTNRMKNGDGININDGASSNTIGLAVSGGGNVISGNDGAGICIPYNSAEGNIIQGNYIGTDASGKQAISNGSYGIYLAGNNSKVGGTNSLERNIISGNNSSGIQVWNANNSKILGNFIGVDSAGANAIGNGAGIVLHGVGLFTTNNVIGGAEEGARNIISGNYGEGVGMGSSAHNNYIFGNYIGLDFYGVNAIPNEGDGINMSGANNYVGGTNDGERNIIAGNEDDGIDVSGYNHYIYNNYIGLYPSGTQACPNLANGITCFRSTNVTVYGNIVSGNGNHGIELRGDTVSPTSLGNQIYNNYIGINSSGTAAIANSNYGVYAHAPNSVIGTGSYGNVISGNRKEGIYVEDSYAAGTIIQGNYVGTTPGGLSVISNNSHGIYIYNTSNIYVGAESDASKNIISGNTSNGIYVRDCEYIYVHANYIGTDATGTNALGNGRAGIHANSTLPLYIGSTNSQGLTIISGNGSHGILIENSSSGDLQIMGTAIGTDAQGTLDLGNAGDGIRMNPASGTQVGGLDSDYNNFIAFNAGNGVTVSNSVSDNNAIRGNAIYSNALLGIDLNDDGITANDPRDPDTGPNNLQNYPVITNVYRASTHIQGRVSFVSGIPHVLDFYLAHTSNREGRIYIGSSNITHTSFSIFQSFDMTLPYTSPTGMWLTATATDKDGNTSEFSTPVLVNAAPDTDGDGLADVWEMDHFGDLSGDAEDDGDSDGFSNADEYIADTNPSDSNSLLELTVIRQTNQNIHITAEDTSEGRVYSLDVATELTSTWDNIYSNVVGESNSMTFTNSAGSVECFRIKAAIPQ